MVDTLYKAPTPSVDANTLLQCVIPSCAVQWKKGAKPAPVHIPNNPHTQAQWDAYKAAHNLTDPYPQFTVVGAPPATKPPP